MGNQVETGLGGSRLKKEADKELYFKPQLLIPGEGVEFTYVDLTTKEELEAVMQDAEGRIMYPQASQTHTGLRITVTGTFETGTVGYSGDVTISGVTLTIVDGLITAIV